MIGALSPTFRKKPLQRPGEVLCQEDLAGTEKLLRWIKAVRIKKYLSNSTVFTVTAKFGSMDNCWESVPMAIYHFVTTLLRLLKLESRI